MNREITAELQYWAKLGVGLRAGAANNGPRVLPSFSASFAGMIAAAKALKAEELRIFDEILKQARERLKPLGEPLEQDFGINRWLAGAREEAYSDWFQWLFGQMTLSEFTAVL